MPISDVRAIDVHAHYGTYNQPGRPTHAQFMTGDADTVLRRARAANTQYTIVSPLLGLMPRGHGDAVAGNEEAARTVEQHDGLFQWVIIDPLKPQTYEQADRMLKTRKCVGVKIHPEEHLYNIKDHGEKLFAFFAERKTLVLTHSGEQRSLPDDFIPLTDAHPEMKLILAHIGCGWNGDLTLQVRALQKSKKGNVYADTSSANSIIPNLIEFAVKEVGADRVLYGTDTPLYHAGMQRIRIDQADLSDADKKKILRDNALGLIPRLAE